VRRILRTWRRWDRFVGCDQDASGGTGEIFVLVVPQRPEEGAEPGQAKRDQNWDEAKVIHASGPGGGRNATHACHVPWPASGKITISPKALSRPKGQKPSVTTAPQGRTARRFCVVIANDAPRVLSLISASC